MKEYIKPEVEIISLKAQEAITDGDGFVDGNMSMEDSEF